MISLNQPREKSENLNTPALSQNGMKGDYARGVQGQWIMEPSIQGMDQRS